MSDKDLKSLLAHSLTLDMDIDAPETTILRSQIIKEKIFLKKLYEEWYSFLASALVDVPPGPVLELGSGGGFLSEFIPGLITSEIFYIPGVNLVIDGRSLPFRSNSLKAIVMIDVFHHISDINPFLAEIERCVKVGGRVAMVEPWITSWSRLIWNYLHHEPIDTNTQDWGFPESGPLSGANSALPWIVFQRDREKFERKFSGLRIQKIELMMPLVYMLSGGVSIRSLMPGWTYSSWRFLENLFKPIMNHLAMFSGIVLERIEK